MKESKTIYFECLQCGVVTPVETTAPKCGQCGHGNGITHPEMPAPPTEKPREDPPQSARRNSGNPGEELSPATA